MASQRDGKNGAPTMVENTDTPRPASETLNEITNRLLPSGFKGTPEQNQASADRQREIRQRDAINLVAGQLGERYSPQRARLETWIVYHPAQKEVLAQLETLSSKLAEVIANGESIIFLGTVGTGKDHLLAGMLYRAASRCEATCRFMSGQDFYGGLRDRMDTGASEDAFLKQLAFPSVLAISDPVPAVGQATDFNLTQLGRLLDRRYRAMKGTWVTLNAMNEDEADERLTAPAWDRLRDSAHIFNCFWPSYRQRSAQCRARPALA